jgi:hypothetical protein
MVHNLVKDLHVCGSYVTGHLPREHPHVADTTHDDLAEEGVFLRNDLTTTPNFWMYSFRAKKVMMLSYPKHWDHILLFMQPGDVPHRIALTDADIHAMYAVDDQEDGDVPVDVVVLADTRPATLFTLSSLTVVLADACPTALLAIASYAVVLGDARPAALFARVSYEVVLTDAHTCFLYGCAHRCSPPPHCLH